MKFLHGKSWWKQSLVVAFTLMSASAFAENCSTTPTSGDTYYIINKGSGQALDVNTNDTSSVPNVITYEAWEPSNQKFVLTKQSDNYWEIKSVYNSMLVEVLDSSTSNGANVDTYTDWDGDNQRWELKVQSDGGFKIVNKNSSLSLTVAGSTNGSNVYQNEDESESSQRWYINPVSGTCGDSSSDEDLVGFASQSGDDGLSTTTGGAAGSTVTVSSCSALTSALESSDAEVIQVADTSIDCRTSDRTVQACALDCSYWNDDGKTWYRVPTSAQTCSDFAASTSDDTVSVTRNDTTIYVQSNKTLVGLGSSSKIIGANLYLSGVENVIIQNLTISNINPSLVEAGDGITVDDSSHVWVDHVAFSKISDGYLDIDNSQNVTASWNRFYGYNAEVCADQHWYTNLVQDSQVTFHHNFWDTAAGRNPKIEGEDARVHLFNNYWKDITYFSIGGDDSAQILVENNYFENSARPQWNIGDAYFSASGNTYTGVSATSQYIDDGATVFSDIDMYDYTLDDADDLGDEVDGGTGPQD
ncbi:MULTISPECIES: RICIN domain-containing protein [Vibrio]|uniref:pectin lyase n=2 Tax=Vibrio TaxID=662 RepID=A0A7X4LML7_9VIBR|nr:MULTISPECIES: RICIN domain-containing protein [Vibrio]MBF9002992.1 RICIN domain-containing protein [Vibrio nitrifigilis]MZI94565.1 pectate lyase [Vibrio eleionomae]